MNVDMVRLSDCWAQERYEALQALLRVEEEATCEMWDFLLSLDGPTVEDLAALEGEGS